MKNTRRSFDWHALGQRFSIRKHHVGAVSILLGTWLALSGGVTAQADEFSSAQQLGAESEATAVTDLPTSSTELVNENLSLINMSRAANATDAGGNTASSSTATGTTVVAEQSHPEKVAAVLRDQMEKGTLPFSLRDEDGFEPIVIDAEVGTVVNVTRTINYSALIPYGVTAPKSNSNSDYYDFGVMQREEEAPAPGLIEKTSLGPEVLEYSKTHQFFQPDQTLLSGLEKQLADYGLRLEVIDNGERSAERELHSRLFEKNGAVGTRFDFSQTYRITGTLRLPDGVTESAETSWQSTFYDALFDDRSNYSKYKTAPTAPAFPGSDYSDLSYIFTYLEKPSYVEAKPIRLLKAPDGTLVEMEEEEPEPPLDEVWGRISFGMAEVPLVTTVRVKEAVSTGAGQNTQYKPFTQKQSVYLKDEAKAEDFIVNKEALPAGTTYTWKTVPDTSKFGSNAIETRRDVTRHRRYSWSSGTVTTTEEKPGVVVVTYPDGTTNDVPVMMKLWSFYHYSLDSASSSANALPSGDYVNYTPLAQIQTVSLKTEVKAEDSIANKEALPAGTTYSWKTPIDTSEFGSNAIKIAGPVIKTSDIHNWFSQDIVTTEDKPGVVVVTYPDNTTYEVPVIVKLSQKLTQTADSVPSPTTDEEKVVETAPAKPEPAPTSHKEQHEPLAQIQTVYLKNEVKAEDSIANKEDLPAGTTYAWKTVPDTSVFSSEATTETFYNQVDRAGVKVTTESKSGVVVVTYPDGSVEEVSVTVNLEESQGFALLNGSEETGSQPTLEEKELDTVPPKSNPTQPVHHEQYEPLPQAQTVDVKTEVKAEDFISNKDALPSGTTYTWKTIPNTSEFSNNVIEEIVDRQFRTAEDGRTWESGRVREFETKSEMVIVTYPDGTVDEVSVSLTLESFYNYANDVTPSTTGTGETTVEKVETPPASGSDKTVTVPETVSNVGVDLTTSLPVSILDSVTGSSTVLSGVMASSGETKVTVNKASVSTDNVGGITKSTASAITTEKTTNSVSSTYLPNTGDANRGTTLVGYAVLMLGLSIATVKTRRPRD